MPRVQLVSSHRLKLRYLATNIIADWAGGTTDYSAGPFSMYLKSMTVTDYSTGTSYSYGDKTGNWQSITAKGGKVNGNSGEEPTSTESAPAITATVDIPIPWSGTHKETASWVTPNAWPWVATDAPSGSADSTGLPAGWESGSRQLQPPAGASLSEISPEHSIPMETRAKIGTISQFTSPFTSVPLASSSVVFSPSGREATDWRNATRHSTTRTKTRFRHHHKTDLQAQDEPTASINSPPHPSASAAAGHRSLVNPFNTEWSFYAFLTGVFVFF